MVQTLVRLIGKRPSPGHWQPELLNAHDQVVMRQAVIRARQLLMEAGRLDVEREAQREIRARVDAA